MNDAETKKVTDFKSLLRLLELDSQECLRDYKVRLACS